MKVAHTIPAKNTWGYPCITDSILVFAKKHECKLIIGLHALKPETLASDQFKIVLCGLPLLLSCDIPIIGYTHSKNGSWIKTGLNKLRKNEFQLMVHALGKSLPDSKALLQFYKSGKVSEEMTPKFVKAHTTEDITQRVLGKGNSKKQGTSNGDEDKE